MTGASGAGPGVQSCGSVRKVRLTITGRQTDPEGHTQENTAVYRAEAAYAAGEEGFRFRYQEGDGESSLFVSRSLVCIHRGERGGTQMRFDPAVPGTECMYATPYGTIPMRIRTRRIAVLDGRSRPGPDEKLRLRARVQYELRMDEAFCLECTVTIRAEE